MSTVSSRASPTADFQANLNVPKGGKCVSIYKMNCFVVNFKTGALKSNAPVFLIAIICY